MPHFTCTFAQGQPMVDLQVGVSYARLKALQAAGLQVPPPQNVRALIDTGASSTCVDPTVFQALQLQPTGTIAMTTPSTGDVPVTVETFDVGIIVPNGVQQGLILPYVQVSACELFAAQAFHVLLGRDVLKSCVLIYNGDQEIFTLSY